MIFNNPTMNPTMTTAVNTTANANVREITLTTKIPFISILKRGPKLALSMASTAM